MFAKGVGFTKEMLSESGSISGWKSGLLKRYQFLAKQSRKEC